MKKIGLLCLFGLALGTGLSASSLPGSVPAFGFEPCAIELHRQAQPLTYFDKAGRKFALLGLESGTFEAWAYPLKLLRNFEFSFYIASSTRPILARDIVRHISVTPAVTTLTYVFQSFRVEASFITAVQDAGAIILLNVDSVEPLTIVCGFLPVLEPMWPAGLGGQYAYWDDGLKAYLISEPTRKNHAFVGSPAATGVSYTPAHMLSDAANEFKIVIADPNEARGVFIPIVLAGGQGDREPLKKIYRKLESNPQAVYREAESHYRALGQSTLRVRTPVREFDLALEWAKVAYDGLLVDNPNLGLGLVAGLGLSGTSGRPGFGWFFGTDAYFNSLSLNSCGAFGSTKAALAFLRKWQREDGKMSHELSQAADYLNWWKDYPYGYIHGDTTPYYIVALYDYAAWSGDAAFVRESWDSLRKAFEWCVSTDADGDGLMDNRKAGLGALEFGSLTGIQTDIYLAAVWVRACQAMREMAAALGDVQAVRAAKDREARAKAAFEARFWDDASGQYSYAFNADGQHVPETTPWSAVGLFWGLGTLERTKKTLERLSRPDMTTDWGVRMMSSQSRYYEPLNYNYGACWPFLTGYVTAALYKHDHVLQAFPLLRSAAEHTFDNALGCVTELFSGHQNIWPQEAVAHQGFSSGGFVLPFVRGLLGLDANVPSKDIAFQPSFPGTWEDVLIENFKAGDAALTLKWERSDRAIRLTVQGENVSGHILTFMPLLAARVKAARINSRPAALEPGALSAAGTIRPTLKVPLSGRDVVELDIEPRAEILPPEHSTCIGCADKGLKIVALSDMEYSLVLVVEGLAGQDYGLPVLNAGLVASVEGAVLDGSRLKITMPQAKPGSFVSTRISIHFKK